MQHKMCSNSLYALKREKKTNKQKGEGYMKCAAEAAPMNSI